MGPEDGQTKWGLATTSRVFVLWRGGSGTFSITFLPVFIFGQKKRGIESCIDGETLLLFGPTPRKYRFPRFRERKKIKQKNFNSI